MRYSWRKDPCTFRPPLSRFKAPNLLAKKARRGGADHVQVRAYHSTVSAAKIFLPQHNRKLRWGKCIRQTVGQATCSNEKTTIGESAYGQCSCQERVHSRFLDALAFAVTLVVFEGTKASASAGAPTGGAFCSHCSCHPHSLRNARFCPL